MKNFFYVLTLAAVVAIAACSDDEKGVSEEQYYQMKTNGWESYGLFGNVKRMERRSYSTDGIAWDSVAKKPVTTLTKTYSGDVVEFNSEGSVTLKLSNNSIITSAKIVDDYIVVISNAMKPISEEKYTYDSKNRLLSYEPKSYRYDVTCAGNDLSGARAWAGDTLFRYVYNNDAFELTVDTFLAYKHEITYDDAAKTATILFYYWDWFDGNWELSSKEVRTLNKYGFCDNNSSVEVFHVKPTATEFESKPSKGTYNVLLDGQGNWTVQYGFESQHVWSGAEFVYQPALTNYLTRDITYY